MRLDEQGIREWKSEWERRWTAMDREARRNALIVAGVVVFLVLVLFSPSCPPQGRMVMGATAPAPSQQLLGRWSGRESLPNRGICTLSLEVRADSSAFSTMICNGELNSTGARYRWTRARGGALSLKPIYNSGVAEALYGCETTWMTLRDMGTGHAAVQWGERKTQGSPSCMGGEMLLRK
jgi:hypothetical protein